MAEGDRLIFEKDRCLTCSGLGWTWWPATPPQEGKWVVCRGCMGTGRSDQTGDKLPKPQGAGRPAP